MLYPQHNPFRRMVELGDFWEFATDPSGKGGENGWFRGLNPEGIIAAQASWNEQIVEPDLMNYRGSLWYQKRFFCHFADEERILLRFGSADFHARVWVNGDFVGEHQGGYLPFEFDISDKIKHNEDNLLIVLVDNTLSHDTIPQGISEQDYLEFGKQRNQAFPSTVFDFFAYGGLPRPVKLIYLNRHSLNDISVRTKISGERKAEVEVEAVYEDLPDGCKIRAGILDSGITLLTSEQDGISKHTFFQFDLKDCEFWSPSTPHLYTLRLELIREEKVIDRYDLPFGVREISVRDGHLLLNEKPVFLKGFGKHEDFPVIAKGLSHAVLVRDFSLMKWIGANSFRTSHYPYAEEYLHLADRMGFLVIDEVPAVSLNFHYVTEKTLENHKKAISELIARDRNHPSVISWSIANEPGIWGEKEAVSGIAEQYWQEIYDHTKALDNTRPITLPTCARWKEKDPGFKYSDFLSVNRYWGWYEIPADLEKAKAVFAEELRTLWEIYRKPILITEFGADTIEGYHALYPQLFTEEYQTELIKTYFKVIESLPFTAGEHIWNFADFKTAQHHRRVVLNKKGIFTRVRDPKSVAFYIRKHWKGMSDYKE